MANNKITASQSGSSSTTDGQQSQGNERFIARGLIHESVRKVKFAAIIQQLVIFLITASAFYPLVNIFSIALVWFFSLAIFSVSIILIFFLKSSNYRSINPFNFAEHLNRCHAGFQESAQLILHKQKTSIGMLQAQRVSVFLINEFNRGSKNTFLPKYKYRKLLAVLLLTFSTNLLSFYINELSSLVGDKSEPSAIPLLTEGKEEDLAITVSEVTSYPLEYTRLPIQKQHGLNIEVTEGSRVEWRLKFNKRILSAVLYFDKPEKMEKMLLDQESESYFFTKNIYATQIYKLKVVQTGSHEDSRKNFEEIYSISIVKDKPPKIKIIKPRENLIEVSRTGKTSFELEAIVMDDYGLGEVNIVASVAKGSGEAVKFRDRVFSFDRAQPLTTKGRNPELTQKSYYKNWSFQQLGMEPGDEVYFSINANDNRMPLPLASSSSSIIYRWLDDQESEITAEGLQIGFVPEYFRSQRQIIIETRELIQDKQDLSSSSFQSASIDLGHSQNDLKTKYGQYLGDEFGEGSGEHFGLADGYHGGEIDDTGHSSASHPDEGEGEGEGEEHHEKAESSQTHSQFHGEIMGEESTNADSGEISAKQALIDQFTHNHGTVEIAPLSNRDPKTWMKMSVNQMWQAEMHLMLSEPSKALPFEEKAYKYLKLARKADRIYAKRLGFKPPPVSEKNRLTGELDDLKSVVLEKESIRLEESSQELFSSLYQLLKRWKKGNASEIKPLDFSQLNLIEEVKNRLLLSIESRPTLIKYVAILEKIVITKQLSLEGCNECVDELANKLWTLLEVPSVQPSTSPLRLNIAHSTKKAYQKKLLRINKTKGLPDLNTNSLDQQESLEVHQEDLNE